MNSSKFCFFVSVVVTIIGLIVFFFLVFMVLGCLWVAKLNIFIPIGHPWSCQWSLSFTIEDVPGEVVSFVDGMMVVFCTLSINSCTWKNVKITVISLAISATDGLEDHIYGLIYLCLFQEISAQNMTRHMVQHLHFRILKVPLIICPT